MPAIVGTGVAGGLVIGVCCFLVVASKFGWSEAPPATEAAHITFASITSGAGDSDTSRDATCDRQAWPYVSIECRDNQAGGNSRKVRVITGDANAPPTFIASPAPIVTARQPKIATSEPKAQSPVQAAVAAPPPRAVIQQAAVQPAVAPAGNTQPQTGAVQPAIVNEAEPVHAAATAAEQRRAERKARAAERRERAAERKAREAAERGKVVVRTIEFADGRKVTITREVGRGGMRQAVAELDRASQRALDGGERRARPQYYSVQSLGYADDED